MTSGRSRLAALAAGLFLLGSPAGPYDIALFPTPRAPGAEGQAQLVPNGSPFGIGVTEDGRASYDVRISAKRLPPPESLGRFSAYVAWATTTDLTQWVRLGAIGNGTTTVGPVELNKFLLVITAEPDSAAAMHTGPTILHGTSPSGWLQSFLTHPLFRGIAQ
ncbi:MAG: hypothetical protein ABI766_15015 [Gemmatimonadales bacterium]